MNCNRRQFLTTLASAMAAVSCSSLPGLRIRTEQNIPGFDYVLTAEPAQVSLIEGTQTPAWCFGGTFPAPVIRAQQGQPIRILFQNRLPEATTIHWHGLRIPIAMDGVPFLSQPPIKPGEDFTYEFTPPDAGTFWYHPHVNSVIQLGKGLVGAFIVEEANPVHFDHEQVLGLKNWHIDDHGQFTEFTTPRNAARMGTPGRWETVNGRHKPVYEVPAGGLTRLRILNLDNTLVYNIVVPDVEAWIIAIDGNPVQEPFRLVEHPIGPGMRLDLALHAPEEPGQEIHIQQAKGRFKFDMARLVAVASSTPIATRPIPTLPSNPLPLPDLDNAEYLSFVFEWEGAVSPGDDSKHKFWTINRRAWDKLSADYVPEPLAELMLGKTYIFDLKNVTPNRHPIHMHGHTWTVLKSNQKEIVPFHTDTVLLEKNEKVRLAFVADNPGRWMYHCHVIEHMKTGLMGYITVK